MSVLATKRAIQRSSEVKRVNSIQEQQQRQDMSYSVDPVAMVIAVVGGVYAVLLRTDPFDLMGSIIGATLMITIASYVAKPSWVLWQLSLAYSSIQGLCS